MSNTKRDWMKDPIWAKVMAEIESWGEGDPEKVAKIRRLIQIASDYAVSVRDRELAGEVEKIHAELSEGDDLVSSVWKDCADCFRDDLLALLSPHQSDAEVGE